MLPQKLDSEKDGKNLLVAEVEDEGTLVDYDFFLHGGLRWHMWPKIMEYVTDPTSIYAAMSASPLLNDPLRQEEKDRALFALGTSYLIRNNYLKDRQSILSTRLVTRKALAVVSEAVATVNSSWAETSNRFEDAAGIHRFLDHFGGHPHAASPFIGDLCSILARDRETFEASLELLRRYGQSLKRCTLGISLDRLTATAFHRNLLQALAYLPNVRWLALKFGGLCDDESEILDDRNLVTFPALTSLMEFELTWNENGGMPSPSKASIRPTLEAYGRHVTKFKCDPLLFRNITPDLLPNIRQLELSSLGWNSSISWELFRKSKSNWPHLESLTLNGNVKITKPNFLAILNGLESNLKELHLWRVEEPEKREVDGSQLKKLVPFGFRNYPNLKKLSVGAVIVWSKLWEILPQLFGSLEFLTIKIENGLGTPIVFPQPYQVDSVDIRMKIFRLFPELKEILWIQTGLGTNGNKEILFQRPSVIRFVDL